MENMNIAIVTDDKEYGKACGLAILNVCRTLVVNVFDKSDFMTVKENVGFSFDGHFDGFDIILWDGPHGEIDTKQVMVYLVEKPSLACRNAINGRYSIFKYSPAQKIVADLFEIYGDITGRKPANVASNGTHIFGFGAWSGGSGCSTIAMAVGQELSKFHKQRVMYLSLEELESTGEFIRCTSSGRTMGFYLYNLFKNRKVHNFKVEEEQVVYTPFMESFVVKDDFGIEAFRPTKGRNPLVDLTSEEICIFIESVMNSGRYDVIVIDAGTSMSNAAITCLEMAERICLVAEKQASTIREINYIQYLMTIGGEDMFRKMIKIHNKANVSAYSEFFDEEDSSDNLINSSITIGRENVCAEEEGISKVLLEGDFGQRISELTNSIIEPLD